MKSSMMLHFIWVFTVCKSARLEFSKYKGLMIRPAKKSDSCRLGSQVDLNIEG